MYYVENETEEKVDLKEVRAILKKIVSYYGEKRDFSVTFVTDSEIQELNKEYREIDAPTDILTVLTGLGTLAFYLGKSDNKQERVEINLKYGIPALIGIGVSLYGNARLFAGSKSLLFASLSSIVANRLGNIANKLYVNHLKKNGEYIQPQDNLSDSN